jgi:hypothetical protein
LGIFMRSAGLSHPRLAASSQNRGAVGSTAHTPHRATANAEPACLAKVPSFAAVCGA